MQAPSATSPFAATRTQSVITHSPSTLPAVSLPAAPRLRKPPSSRHAAGTSPEGHHMKICVFGAGAIGGHLAMRLHKGGADVSLVARGAHLAAIQANGLSVHAV